MGRHEAGLGERLAALARPGEIYILSSQTCAPCAQARGRLTCCVVAFSECTIETDTACAVQFEASHVPGTLVFLERGQPQLGFDAQRVIDTLERTAPES